MLIALIALPSNLLAYTSYGITDDEWKELPQITGTVMCMAACAHSRNAMVYVVVSDILKLVEKRKFGLYTYDTKNMEWFEKAPPNRVHLGERFNLVEVNENLYVLGSRATCIEEYNIGNNQWTLVQLTEVPRPKLLKEALAFVLDEDILISGGKFLLGNDNVEDESAYKKQVVKFNPKDKTLENYSAFDMSTATRTETPIFGAVVVLHR